MQNFVKAKIGQKCSIVASKHVKMNLLELYIPRNDGRHIIYDKGKSFNIKNDDARSI